MLDENLANFADAEEQMWYKNGKRANMSNNIEFELNFEIFEIILPLFVSFLCIFILSAYECGGKVCALISIFRRSLFQYAKIYRFSCFIKCGNNSTI